MNPDKLFTVTAELNFLTRLRSDCHKLVFACDEPFASYFREHAPELHVTPLTDDGAIDAGPDDLVVCAIDHEEEHAARLSRAQPNRQVYSLQQELLARRVAQQVGRPRSDHSPSPPNHRYAVFCTPRSGSTHFCDCLEQLKLGKPREHVRRPLIELTASLASGDEKRRFVDRVTIHGALNGVFGTKVISHYLFALLDPRRHDCTPIVDVLREFSAIYVVRRDKVLQAISLTYARTGQFHARSETQADAMRAAMGEYDYEAILASFLRLKRQEDRLATFIRDTYGHDAMIVSYEDEIERDVSALCRRTYAFVLGKDAIFPDVELRERNKKVRGTRSQEYAERFSADYKRRHGHDC